MQLVLQGDDLRLGRRQGLIEQHGALHEQVRGIRLACSGVQNAGFGLRVLGPGACLRQLGQEVFQGLQFLRGHGAVSYWGGCDVSKLGAKS